MTFRWLILPCAFNFVQGGCGTSRGHAVRSCRNLPAFLERIEPPRNRSRCVTSPVPRMSATRHGPCTICSISWGNRTGARLAGNWERPEEDSPGSVLVPAVVIGRCIVTEQNIITSMSLCCSFFIRFTRFYLSISFVQFFRFISRHIIFKKYSAMEEYLK